jgi:peptidoglycan hydrolase CwlO-like protein
MQKFFKLKIIKGNYGILSLLVLFLFTLFVLFNNPIQVEALTPQERATLEAELAQLEADIAQKEAVLSSQKNTSKSLSDEVRKLQSQINTAKSKVSYHKTQIKNISGDIESKQNKIVSLDNTIELNLKSLGDLLRKTNKSDELGVLHALLSKETLSQFYLDTDSYGAIKKSLQANVNDIRGVKIETNQIKEELEEKKDNELNAQKEIERQKSLVEASKKDQDRLLDSSKDKEKEYQSLIAERQAEAIQIRAELFELRGAQAIPFGDAYNYAIFAEQKTGVDPALILAILTQESNLGKNVGQCLLTNFPNKGNGIGKNTGTPFTNLMKPTRDVDPFMRILEKLGADPSTTPVSCPLSYGYGGAMGPSQFIPSTWEWIEPKIIPLLGVSTPDPWNPQHAVMATARYMQTLGAASSDWTNQWNAACKYYSGRKCTSPNVVNKFYGDGVMKLKSKIQIDIDVINSI